MLPRSPAPRSAAAASSEAVRCRCWSIPANVTPAHARIPFDHSNRRQTHRNAPSSSMPCARYALISPAPGHLLPLRCQPQCASAAATSPQAPQCDLLRQLSTPSTHSFRGYGARPPRQRTMLPNCSRSTLVEPLERLPRLYCRTHSRRRPRVGVEGTCTRDGDRAGRRRRSRGRAKAVGRCLPGLTSGSLSVKSRLLRFSQVSTKSPLWEPTFVGFWW